MHIASLDITDFRNITAATLDPDPTGTTVITGRNGTGKTSLLEAVAYLSTLQSFRGSPKEAMVRAGAGSAILRARTVVGDRPVEIEAELTAAGRSRTMVNRQTVRRRTDLHDALRTTVFSPEDIGVVRDGTYVCIEGPQFSTLAESLTYKQLGYSVIGMTNLPEAKLAREAEICYATVAMVTDFDCWHPDHDAVTVQDIIKVLIANAEKAARLVGRLAKDFPRQHEPCPIGSDRALDSALITAPKARDPKLIKKLDAVARRVLHP